MTKYLIKRILRALLSVVIVVAVIMTMVYVFLDKEAIFASDPTYSKRKSNSLQAYKMQQWERYGYLDYVPFEDYLQEMLVDGEIDNATYEKAVQIGKSVTGDNKTAESYIASFKAKYKAMGYKIVPLKGELKGNTVKYVDGGQPRLYAYKDVPLVQRLWKYLTGIVTVDNIHKASGDVGERGISFTWYDPAYGGEKFSPAIMGNGTQHKYLFYMNDKFPYIHQNLVSISLGTSFSVNKGIDVFQTMTDTQGSLVKDTVYYPSGVVEVTADNLHSLTYLEGSRSQGALNATYYNDDYTVSTTNKDGKSKMGYSFVIGIIAVILSYLVAVPMGIGMALKKDKLLDKLGTFYIVFITAVPSLAYIFMFKAIGNSAGLPTTFDMLAPTWLMYVLPIVSLSLPSIASTMKWLRRYMIDQMNSDYVKFARSGGLSEGEIFSKHILKNAIIPIVHGLPASVLFAMTGAIITERVYVVPGAGNLLTTAINKYDNGVIVGVALFYAILTVASVIIGDVLMAAMDPRISFTAKER